MPTEDYETFANELDAFLAEAGPAAEHSETSSSRLAKLSEQAAERWKRIEAEQQAAESAVQDPSRSRDQLKASREHLEAVKTDAFRLSGVAEKLNAAYVARRPIEEEARRVAAYDAAKKERDAIAGEVKAAENTVAELVKLIQRILAANEQIDKVNSDLPQDRPKLNRPEGHARGFLDYDDNVPISDNTFRLTQSILPDLSDLERAAWPQVPFILKVRDRGKVFTHLDVRSMFRRSTE